MMTLCNPLYTTQNACLLIIPHKNALNAHWRVKWSILILYLQHKYCEHLREVSQIGLLGRHQYFSSLTCLCVFFKHWVSILPTSLDSWSSSPPRIDILLLYQINVYTALFSSNNLNEFVKHLTLHKSLLSWQTQSWWYHDGTFCTFHNVFTSTFHTYYGKTILIPKSCVLCLQTKILCGQSWLKCLL